jgi:DNA-binding GntR family transcriptional regulator
MELKAIQTSTLQEAVYDELVSAILSGKIAPGERITLEKIARQLNVSIMPVREALRRLEAGGFVSIEKNKRIAVRELSSETLKEILEVRLILESVAIEKATKIRNEETISRLEELMKPLQVAENEEKILEANKEFHFTIYRQANMPILMEVITWLWERVSPYLHILIRTEKDWNRDNIIKIHAGMLEGMRHRNSAEVCKWLRLDLTEAAELILRTFGPEMT